MVSPPRLGGQGTDVTLAVEAAILVVVAKAVAMEPLATGPVAKLAELVSVNVSTGGTTAVAAFSRTSPLPMGNCDSTCCRIPIRPPLRELRLMVTPTAGREAERRCD